MELKLVPKLSQQLVMTPQLKMAIKLLTLNHLELRDAVAQELIENPVLDESFDEGPRPDGAEVEATGKELSEQAARSENSTEVSMDGLGTEKQKDNATDIDWDNYLDSYSYLPPSAGSGRDSQYDDMPGIDQTLTRAETLEEHLMWQVRMGEFNQIEVEIAERLVGEMNDAGFLDAGPVQEPPPPAPPADAKSEADATPTQSTAAAAVADLGIKIVDDAADVLENEADEAASAQADETTQEPALSVDPIELVANDIDLPLEWVEKVRQRMMRLDPIGCLARDLRECLLVQLEVWGYDDECLVYNMVDQYMPDLERRNYQQIAKAAKVPLADVGDAVKILEQLEPRPARNFLPGGSNADAQYITPDVYVQKVGEEYVISLNEDGLPKLKLSPFYMSKLRSSERGDPSKTYIKDKMRSATWLIRSIHQRQRTIYKVVESILRTQRDWFDGNAPLKPLILKEVADDIEMHESTVSRVTTRKYLHCHRGIFELKYFFNSSIATGDGASIASEAVKDEIKRIVSGENPKKPLSDAAIVKLLKERNIDIARRTVAKYREMLGILPSNRRKQVF